MLDKEPNVEKKQKIGHRSLSDTEPNVGHRNLCWTQNLMLETESYVGYRT